MFGNHEDFDTSNETSMIVKQHVEDQRPCNETANISASTFVFMRNDSPTGSLAIGSELPN
jgi:hypothetical protein